MIRDKKLLMPDTGLAHRLLAGAFDEALRDKKGDLRTALDPPWSIRRTPFAFMEWIGLSGKRIATPPEFVPDNPITSGTVAEALAHYLGHYSKCPELQQESLQKLWEAQNARMDAWAQQFWKPMTGSTLTGWDTAGWLQTALALDAVYKLDLPSATGSEYYSELIAHSFFTDNRLIRNLSKFRLAKRLWDRSRNKLAQGQELPPEITQAHAAMAIKSKQDYLDCDLIHSAVLGVEDEDGLRHQVTCLTCDDPDILETRLGIYRGLLAYARKLYDDAATAVGYPEDYDSYMNGCVFCFDEAGILLRCIDVQVDTEALPFLGALPGDEKNKGAEEDAE